MDSSFVFLILYGLSLIFIPFCFSHLVNSIYDNPDEKDKRKGDWFMYNDELPDNFVDYLFYISGILRNAYRRRLISSLGTGVTFLVLCKLVKIGISKKG